MPNHFIKPVRRPDADEDFETCVRQNWAVGAATNVCFDLNILARIRDAFDDPAQGALHDLPELAQKLSVPGLILNPGFAYREMDRSKVDRNAKAFEHFLSRLRANYCDTPDATWTPDLTWLSAQEDDAPRSYWALPAARRESLICPYIAHLMLRIDRRYLREPKLQFLAYLHETYQACGRFLLLEARIAQFVFFDRSDLPHNAWHKFCGDIRSNFNKSARDLPKLQSAVLNQVLDTALLRAAQVLHHRNPLEREVWVVTRDQGLANFAKSFCFSPDHCAPGGIYSAFIELQPFAEMETADYWRQTDALKDNFMGLAKREIALDVLEATARQIEQQILAQMQG